MYPSLLQQLSRVPLESPSTRNEYDSYAEEHDSGIFITGRVTLNIWKIMRSELKLTDYSLHNISQQLLHQTLPKYSNKQLTNFYQGEQYIKQQRIVLHYLLQCTICSLRYLEKLDFFRRTIGEFFI